MEPSDGLEGHFFMNVLPPLSMDGGAHRHGMLLEKLRPRQSDSWFIRERSVNSLW